MASALLLINPGSRSGKTAATEVRQALAAKGFTLLSPPCPDPQLYAKTIRDHKGRCDLVVVGGGDGSLHLALPGILDSELPLGVIPLGTANNFARNIALPLEIAGAVAVIAGGNKKKVDVATVNGRPFLNVSGLGLSTEVNRNLPKTLKRKWGAFSYVLYAFKVARRMRPFHATIKCDGKTVRVRTFQVTICNGRFYGPGLAIADDAKITDGALDLASTEVDTWWHGVQCVPGLLRGDYSSIPCVRWYRATAFEIATRRPFWVDADGEIVGKSPVRYAVDPRGLTVFAP